jgi:isoleucyl-tRNA synthetase
LLEACGTRGRAPYDAILTHGFLMSEEGRKMSKSLGNDVSPQDVIKQSGADILRLWVASSDYTEDLRFGPEIAKQLADTYRRLRNTLRYLLGNLAGFGEDERLPYDQMPELERWVLQRIWDLDKQMREACNGFVFHHYFAELHNFCAVDLSAFYFDIRKDVLYCDAKDSVRRRAARTVLDILFQHLTTWLAPVLCFTAEDAWLARYPDSEGSVHLLDYPEVPGDWRDDALAARWEKIRDLRRVVTGALEVERREKRIGSSLQAKPQVHAAADYVEAVDGLDLGELCITSDAILIEGEPPAGAYTIEGIGGVGVVSAPADGTRCERCWKVLPEVGTVAGHDDLCGRCADAVDKTAS